MYFTMSGFPAYHNTLDAGQLTGLARLTEAVGLDRFGVTDFPFHHDCIAVMTGCLLATERISIESLVTSPYHRAPDVTACAFSTMDDFAPGRVILGIGRGTTGTQVGGFVGNDRIDPMRDMADMVRVCREMWAGGVPAPGDLPVAGMPLMMPARSLPILIAARGPRMLRLAAEQADIVHLALPFLGPHFTRASISWVEKCAAEVGRSMDDLEIDLTVAWSVLEDDGVAHDVSKLLVVTTILLAAEVWETAGKTFGLDEDAWREDFPVDAETLAAVRASWKAAPEQRDDGLPQEIAALLNDEIVAATGVAGGPEAAYDHLARFLPEVPGLTGLRYKLPPLGGPLSRERFEEMITHAGTVTGRLRENGIV